MSNSTRPDFSQKLLNDLKMRKERMVATQSTGRNSGNIAADSYGSSRRSLKGSTEMKSLAKVTSNTAKLQRGSNSSQRTRMSTETSNQIVPYGGGQHSKQPLDMSMTLSYALDDNGKLKKMNLTGSNAMIGFLNQISRRTMDFANQDGSGASSRIQWPSTAQFPTLTHLHIDEVSKGAQRLNKILKTFYNGVNSNGCSVDIGKELLKGAVELEESLRMLVSLQEASECMVVPQRKSRVKLLEMGEENDDDGKGDKGVKKRVDRPVFSFDRRTKNEHRRSASCGAELKTPQVTSSQSYSKPQGAGISNVVAKLMGLEEIPRNGGESNKVGNQLVRSNNNVFGVSRSEFGDEDAWSIGPHSGIQEGARSNKIVILTSKKIEPQKEWSQREREQIMTHGMQLNRKDRGVKKHILKDEAQKAANLAQGRRVSKENGLEKTSVSKVLENRVGRDKSVRDGRVQNLKLEPKNGKKGRSKVASKKVEAVIENPSPKDIYEVRSSQASLPSFGQAKDEKDHVTLENSIGPKENSANLKPKQDLSLDQEEAKSQANESSHLKTEASKKISAAIQKVAHSTKTTKSGPNRKANEVMAKPAKSVSSRPSRAMKQQATIMQGLKQRQSVNKGSQQPNTSASTPIESHGVRSNNAGTKPVGDYTKQHMEVEKAIVQESSYSGVEALDNVPRLPSNEDVNLKLDQPLMAGKDPESKPQTNELVQVSDNREIPWHLHKEKEALPKFGIQQPLTEDEIYLKHILITSQVFLNTAEALFKLNIPIGILNASDIICQEEKDAKQVIDCAYEMLKMKGKRRELVFYHCKNALISDMRLRSLDDLVRQLYKDFENLRSYGKTGNSEFDQAEYLMKMLERDMHHNDMDLNCMWDMGWNKTVFAYIEMDEAIRDVEKCMLNELLDDVLEGFMEISPHITHGEDGGNIKNGVIGVTVC